MALRRTVAPAGPAVPVISVLEQLRVGSEPDDLLHITGLIGAATGWVEEYLGRALIQQGWELTLDAWPADKVLRLEPSQVISLTEVRYVSEAGVSTVLAPGMYQLDAASIPARLAPSFGNAWPALRMQMAAVTVTYLAGYGASWNDVPEGIRHAIMMFVAHLYENRETVNVGNIVSEMPFSVKALLAPYRVWRHG